MPQIPHALRRGTHPGDSYEAKMQTFWFRRLLRFIARHFLNIHVQGKPERVDGPVIYACNHLSFADPPVAWGAQKGQVIMIAMEALWRLPFKWLPLSGIVLNGLGFIPVSADRAKRAEVSPRAVAALKAGVSVGIFPQGYCAKPDESVVIRPGVAAIAFESGRPVQLMAVAGTNKVWPHHTMKIRRRELVVLMYGELYRPGDFLMEEDMLARLQADLGWLYSQACGERDNLTPRRP